MFISKFIKKAYFSLIELMIVIGIIALLSGIVLMGLTIFGEKSEMIQTVKLIKDIEGAMQRYYNAFGSYPSQSNANGQLTSTVYLTIRPFISGGNLQKHFLKDDNITPVDSWGRLLYYSPYDSYQNITASSNYFKPKMASKSGQWRNPTTIQILSTGKIENDTLDDLTNHD
jgi:prepilin-type N-terminal cleavage/methylation domain-containing protein